MVAARKKTQTGGRRVRRGHDAVDVAIERGSPDSGQADVSPERVGPLNPEGPGLTNGCLDPEPTRFFGREGDLKAVDASFREGCRLVTILGPPGMGKTRLAVRYLAGWGDGEGTGLFCDLRATQSPRELCTVLAQALDARFDATDDPTRDAKTLAHLLSAHDANLLVLDNFEQLAEAAGPFVADGFELPRACGF